jgi:two-component system LytT family response regulator
MATSISRPDLVVRTDAGPRLAVRDGRHIQLVPLSSILWVESFGNYVRVQTAAARRLHRVTIERLASALAPHGFWRIHRKIVVNAARVREFRPRGVDRVALLDTGERLPVGRTYRDRLALR